jgi:hypothetical protein
MNLKRRVFVSVPQDEFLDERQKNLKTSILKRIASAGFEPEIFFASGMAAGMTWTFDKVEEVINRCHGAVIVGFPRWRFSNDGEEIRFPTEYNHYEGALANSLKIPVLTIAEEGIPDRGIHWTGGGNQILFIPQNADIAWLASPDFRRSFKTWTQKLGERKDVFLGYCSRAKGTAQAIHLFLSNKLKLSVMDWAMDFTGGGTILEEIDRSSRLCTCGIFLFTKDDPLEGDNGHAAPRDNVVFEAGYFMRAKGKERVAIIREEGAKMPADLGGNIYIHLPDKDNTASVEGQLRDFLERRL